MFIKSPIILLLGAILLISTTVQGAETSREQVQGLDEQVQEIKTDVLGIAAELNRLEEKLLYPSNTQVALFVSLAEEEAFRLDSLAIRMDGEEVAHHLYSFKELEALRRGGVQQIHTANLRGGEHALEVTLLGQTEGGAEIRKTESFQIRKGVGPEFFEISLARNAITLKDR